MIEEIKHTDSDFHRLRQAINKNDKALQKDVDELRNADDKHAATGHPDLYDVNGAAAAVQISLNSHKSGGDHDTHNDVLYAAKNKFDQFTNFLLTGDYDVSTALFDIDVARLPIAIDMGVI